MVLIMNTSSRKALACASGLIWLSAYYASSALAINNETDYPAPMKASSPSKARAEVQSEYVLAAREGLLQRNDLDYPPAIKTSASAMTRADASAEYTLALRNESHPLNNEFAPSFVEKHASSNLTREAVRAETMEWLRASRGDTQMGSQ